MLTVLTVKSSASQEDHLFSVISADPSTAEKHSSKSPCQGIESHPERAWNPARSFGSWSLSMSEWSTVVLVGTYYLLIQIFGHFILSKCTSSNTSTSVSCETTKLLDAWLFAGGTPLYLPPHEMPLNGLCLVWVGRLNWVASLKPPPAKIVPSTGAWTMSGKDDVSFVYFRMGSGFPFGR